MSTIDKGHVDDAGPADPVRRQPVQALPGAEDVLRRGTEQSGGVVGGRSRGTGVREPQCTPEMPVPTRPSAVRISTTGTVQCAWRRSSRRWAASAGTASAYVSTEVMTAPSSPGARSACEGRQQPQRVVRHLESHSVPLVARCWSNTLSGKDIQARVAADDNAECTNAGRSVRRIPIADRCRLVASGFRRRRQRGWMSSCPGSGPGSRWSTPAGSPVRLPGCTCRSPGCRPGSPASSAPWAAC
jgi:hypothetical protein